MTALYTKYRPQKLSELIGQEHVTDALSKALSSNRLHHAYILSGPRGCGKTSTARILAMSINCVNGPTPDPCGVCNSCVTIRERTSMDVTELDAASKGGVDDARELRERVRTRPSSLRKRIFIIDEAHMMSTAALNALLTVFETPPEFVVFIMATTEPEKILPTIHSRSFIYPFRLVSALVMLEHIKGIIAKEGSTVSDDVLPMVVRAGGGSVRDTLSILDQLLSGVGGEELSVADAAKMLGMTDEALLSSAADAIMTRDAGALYGLTDQVSTAGIDARRFCADILVRLRDLLVMKTVPGALSRGLVGPFTESETATMTRQSEVAEVSSLTRASSIISTALDEMRGATNTRLTLELAIARLTSGEDERLARLEQMVKQLLNAPVAPSIQVQQVAPPLESVPAPVEAPVEAAPQLPPAPQNPESWARVVEVAGDKRKAAGALLGQQAKVVKLENGTCVLTFGSEGVLRVFETHKETAVAALSEVLGGTWTIETSVA